MDDEITDAEINETIDRVRILDSAKEFAFARDLQIRDSGAHGLGLVWAGEGETWAITPDPFYTKEFLSSLKSMCNRIRRLSVSASTSAQAVPAAEGEPVLGYAIRNPPDSGERDVSLFRDLAGAQKHATALCAARFPEPDIIPLVPQRTAEAGWVPITERKPKDCDRVLVAYWSNIDGVREVRTGSYDGETFWIDTETMDYDPENLTHWRELPPPPTGVTPPAATLVTPRLQP